MLCTFLASSVFVAMVLTGVLWWRGYLHITVSKDGKPL
jgi:hypothetical protein